MTPENYFEGGTKSARAQVSLMPAQEHGCSFCRDNRIVLGVRSRASLCKRCGLWAGEEDGSKVAEKMARKSGRDGVREVEVASRRKASLVLFVRWRERWRDGGIALTCMQRALFT